MVASRESLQSWCAAVHDMVALGTVPISYIAICHELRQRRICAQPAAGGLQGMRPASPGRWLPILAAPLDCPLCCLFRCICTSVWFAEVVPFNHPVK